MKIVEKKSALGYGKPPWVFKGSALYQLHLVKAETARALIPKEFKLVEAFGYTLGGFFLANYEDSPAGNFDELVVLAGIVWNPPTSCAWAARVLVSSGQACAHGRKKVGLPSQVASFTKRVTTLPETKRGPFHALLNKIHMDDSSENMKSHVTILVEEMIDNHKAMSLGSINLTTDALITPQTDTKRWMGPSVKLSLPSFSGRTEFNPDLLKYSCRIECRLRAVQPAQVVGPLHGNGELTSDTDGEGDEDIKRNLSISVMLSKPILALEFSRLNMKVEAPTTVVPQ